jgi:PAS domain S-box-containing protein
MSERSNEKEAKKQLIKDLIQQLHAGVSPDEVKEKFKGVLKDIGPAEIAQVEEELINEGLPRQEIQKLCEVHLAVFRESLEKPRSEVPPGHPIHILLKEHELVKGFVEGISALLPKVEQARDLEGMKNELSRIGELLAHLKEYDRHKVREENTLFPTLEKHGVTQPPAIMWTEHDEQRKEIKEAIRTLEDRETLGLEEFKGKLLSHLKNLTALIPDHFYKEENILFPMALELIGDAEWNDIKASMDDLGYCYFTPEDAIGEKVALKKDAKGQEGEITFEIGSITKDELEAILNTLPVDITFVDKEDTVRYFSQSKERIFPRAKAVIGRKVQQCHPQKSVDVVIQILDDFRNGRRDAAEFWIQLKERLILIRYFAIRSKENEYLGCLEVTQDITDLKKIEGEKRLLEP